MLVESSEMEILGVLDRVIFSHAVFPILESKVAEARETFDRSDAVLASAVAVPLSVFGDELPNEIASCRIFILRSRKESQEERHPNSRQRLVAFHGTGALLTQEQGEWVSYELSTDRSKEISKRWVSIPENMLHKPVAFAQDWVALSFHTASDEELIDEYPIGT